MIKSLFVAMLVAFCMQAFMVHAEDKPIPPETLGWMQRALVPEAIAKLKKSREVANWCLYERQQEQPDPRACAMAERLTKEATIEDDAMMIRTGISQLKKAPQTPIIQEHIRVLEAAMGEIMYSLRGLDEK